MLAVAAVWVYTAEKIDTTGALDFEQELAIPPLLEPAEDDDGTLVYELDLQSGSSDCF